MMVPRRFVYMVYTRGGADQALNIGSKSADLRSRDALTDGDIEIITEDNVEQKL